MATAAAAELGGTAGAPEPGGPVRPRGVGAARLCSAGLVVEGGAAAARAPARLTEVAHATVGYCRPRSLIAAAVEDEGGAADRSHVVWLLVVDEGEEALRQHLRAFSALGAVRADFCDEYAVSAKPFCSGGSAALYTVSPHRRGSSQPTEFAAKVKVLQCSEDFTEVESEAALLRMAQGHPNIIRLHGQFLCLAGEPAEGAESQVGEQGTGGSARKYVSQLPMAQPCHVLVTDLCRKGDLDDHVTAKGPYSEATGLQLIVGLLSALAHVHGIGLVHRDVKSQNVLLGAGGRPLLADFGSAARLSDAEAMKGIAGTLGYAAPEIYLGEPYGEQVDVFGAGVVLYFALLARLPFAEGQSRETVAESTVQCCVQFPSCAALSTGAKQLVRSLLTRKPIHRPSSRTAMEAAKRLQPQQRREAEPQALKALKPLQSQQPGRAERPAFKKVSWKLAPEKVGRQHAGGNDCEVLSNESTEAPSSPMSSESAERQALEEASRKVALPEKAGHRYSGDKDCEALSNQPTKVPISPVMLGTSERPALEEGSRNVEPDSARCPSMNSDYELLSSHSMASSASRTRFQVCACQKADRCHSGDKDCEALSDQPTKVAMSSVILGMVERPGIARHPSESEGYELLSNASTASFASQGRFRVCQVGPRRRDRSQEKGARSRATSQQSLDATKLSVGNAGTCLARQEVPFGRRVLTDIRSSLSRCQLQLQKRAL